MPEPLALNLHILLDEVSEFNGPLWFIRGSHKAKDVPAALDTATTSYPLWCVDRESVARLANQGGLLSAKLLVDRKSKQILKIEFGQQAESDDYAGELTEASFAERFVGKEIVAAGNTFGLLQRGESKIQGQSEIDGISGATVTSQGVINMMNKGLEQYAAYLFGNE